MARIDLDILQIGIFMETLAYDAAMDYYTIGFNSKATSLQEIATSKSRMVVATQYDLYSSFFNSTTYAHDIVMQALQGQAPFTNACQVCLTCYISRSEEHTSELQSRP